MITVRNVTLRRGVKVVLQGATFTLNPGEKVGLVGRNGAGKSSLFALLAGRLHADAGDVEMPPRWRLGEVAQQMPETDQGATDFVLDGDAPLVAARGRAGRRRGERTTATRMAEAHMAHRRSRRLRRTGRARRPCCSAWAFAASSSTQPVNSFSGGWRMRLQLARALMCPADLLLLDEPTNHLDLDALVWLEAWLQRFAGTLVIISHDREFLDAVTRVTLHVDEAQVTRYGANYSGFEEMRAERMSQQQAAFAKQQERIAHLQRFIDRFKAKASKAKQAQSRVKALARMETHRAGADRERLRVRVPRAAEPAEPDAGDARPRLRVRRAPSIVRDVNRTVMAGQRIGILGANGQGKSTLVKTIARALSAARRHDDRRQGPGHRLLRAAGDGPAAPRTTRRCSA